MPHSDSDLRARALDAFLAAGQRAARGRPSVDDALTLAELAAAGLVLRSAAMRPRDGAALGVMGAVTPQSAIDAYDARLRAALGHSTDAATATGAAAGEAET